MAHARRVPGVSPESVKSISGSRIERRQLPGLQVSHAPISQEDFADLIEYLHHDSWRCDYYAKCHCGLDDLTDKLGLPRVPRTNPNQAAMAKDE